MIVYDDLEHSEKVKVYDKGITLNRKQSPEKIYEVLVGYRTGDMMAPNLDMAEALRVEAAHFVRCLEAEDAARSPTGARACAWCEILEAATESMTQPGPPDRAARLGAQVAAHSRTGALMAITPRP